MMNPSDSHTIARRSPIRNARSRHRPARPAWVWPVALFLILSLPACSSWRDSYLKDAQGNASQEEVIDTLGEPWKKKTSLLKNQSTWIYRYALTKEELDPMGVSTLGRSMFQATESVGAMMGLAAGNADKALNPGSRPLCFHYILTFDNDTGLLRHWVREACADTAS